MIKPDQIPDEVWHTAMSTYHRTISKRPGHAWQVAIAAALNAWPGVFLHPMNKTRLVLPLPQEARDE